MAVPAPGPLYGLAKAPLGVILEEISLREEKTMEIPANIKKMLEDPKNVKTLTTVNTDGNPYSVPVNSVSVMADGNIAFMELLDR